jgi:hypothetical protein
VGSARFATPTLSHIANEFIQVLQRFLSKKSLAKIQ